MAFRLAVVTALATTALAQTSVLTLSLPGFEPQAIQGSVIYAAPTVTRFFLSCPSDTPSDECGLGPGVTFLQGPSTLSLHMSMSDDVNILGEYADVACAISADTAVCSSSFSEPASLASFGDTTLPSLTSDTITDFSQYLTGLPVTITAGLDKLGAVGAAVETGPSMSRIMGAETVAPATGGLPRITQNAVLAGVAAAMGGLLAL